MDEVELKKLAQLARISVSDGELSGLKKDMEAILTYVSRIKEVVAEPESDATAETEAVVPVNVMREDREPHESGVYSRALLSGVPETEDEYVKVKKIL